MEDRLSFSDIYRVDGYGLIVVFSDGTSARYTVEEMAQLRPMREPAEKVKEAATS